MFATILNHESWNAAYVFARSTQEEANEAARACLLEETREYREYEEWPTGTRELDDAWIELCLSESWTIDEGVMR